MASYLGHIGFKNIYDYFNGKKQREKLDYILEPFQAMTQLALLSFCPVGSKLTINDNILTIQQPGISQGIIRYFNDDNKEDLYYLMNVFRRFFDYYKFMLDSDEELYNLLIKLSIKGIDKLTETYTNTDKINVLHTLQMYKVVLTNRDFFNSSDINSDTNIDNIFIKISEIYKKEEYVIILNLLTLLEKNCEGYSNYIDGVNIIMDITNKKIKQWIDKNIL
jgi:hypothetical protein